MVRWLPQSAIHAIHGELMAEHGGLAGSVNDDMLGATLARPQHLESYNNCAPSIFQLAASYGFGFARNHCFTDGNKRITLASIDVFLIMNDYELIAEEVDAVLTIEALASGDLTEDELTTWIEANAQPYKE